MSGDAQTFHNWLQELPDLSFTWSGPPPCGLEQKRRQLISLLEHSHVEGRAATSLKGQVIKRLSSIRCRQID